MSASLQPAKLGISSDRATLFPIKDHDAYRFAKLQENRFWSSSELIFTQDREDYRSLSLKQSHLIDTVIAFFLPGDGLINNNLIHRFLMECKSAEETFTYIMILAIEAVHGESYSLMGYTFYGEKRMEELQTMANAHPQMLAKTDFIEKYTNSQESWPVRLFAMACAEGVFFSVLFAVIFWFRAKGLFKNLITANEMISEDERIHRDFGCYLYRKHGKMSEERVTAMIDEVIKIEEKFIDWMLPEPIEDLNKEDFKTYLLVVVDNLLVEAGHNIRFHAKNPFPFMDNFSMTRKANLYERRTGAYTRFNLEDALDIEKRAGHVVETDIYEQSEEVDW